jgi:hypothetical protein
VKRRRARQLQLGLAAPVGPWIPKDKEREVVEALAELLLAAAQEAGCDERREDDERQDHR